MNRVVLLALALMLVSSTCQAQTLRRFIEMYTRKAWPMIKRLVLLLLLLINFSATAWAASVTLVDRQGQPHPIQILPKTAVIAFATWCPCSRGLASLLKDSQVKPYTKDVRFIFALTEEWPHVEAALQERGQMDKLGVIKQRSGDDSLYRPEVLSGIAGESLFITSDQIPLIKGFPYIYSVKSGKFDKDIEAWLLENTKIPKALLTAKVKGYGLD